jgi:hypothetical protein
MLKFWFIETLVVPPSDWNTAKENLTIRLEEYRDLAEMEPERWLARWQKIFGGHAPPMPKDLTVCRVVEAKGQERKVGTVSGLKFRRSPGAPTERRGWTRTEKTLYVVADPEPGARKFLSRIEWPWLPNGMIGYKTQREAIERARSERRRGLVLFRVDTKLLERERRGLDSIDENRSAIPTDG